MRRAIDAVVARTAAAFDDAAGVGVAVGSRLAVNHRAVARAAAAEVVALDAAGETVAFGNADDVDAIAWLEIGSR